MKLTGVQKDPVRFGFDRTTGKPRVWIYDRFTFPACSDCNNRYSELESHVEPIIRDMMPFQMLCAKDFELLLDWFDNKNSGVASTHLTK